MIYSVFDAHESALRSIRRVVTETAPSTPTPVAAAAVVKQLQAGNVLVVTGAGVSTDSGIPDYRGPDGSLRHHRPMTYQEFRGDDHARRRYWARSYLGWRHLAGAQPNYVHRCLSTLEAAGHLTGIVTQNVDGLHQAAGSCTVIPLHGDLATVICLSCGAREDRREYDARMTIANPGFAEAITLAPGTWQGNYTINIPITLSGSPNGDTILDGGGKGKVLHLKAPDSTIEYLTVRHSGNSPFDMDSGIFADRKAARAHIHHNRAENNLFGLYIWGPENALVEHNTVIGQNEGRVNDRGNAIQIWKSPHTIIRDNTLSGGRDGIYVTNSKYNLFENNTMRNMRFGVHYMYTEDSEVAHNHTENLESAYVIMFSNRITVRDNSGQDSREHGLMLNAVNDAKIHGNRIERANKCVFLYNANRNAFHDNHFENCTLGIHSTAGSTDNQNYRNSFIDNQTQVMYVGTRYHEWSHDGQGNYWSDNSAFDLNGDGIADLPYRPNNILDQVLWRAPNAKILINSPAAQLLKYAQQQFPAIHPGGVVDSYPLMNPPQNP
mgnify:CR=1 FL=1